MQAIAPIFYGACTFDRVREQFGSERRYLIVCDRNTRKLCLPLFAGEAMELPPVFETEAGEGAKTLATCERLWTFALENGFDRDSVWINLGGGMVSDLGGFAAACYKRGVAFVNVPTTLLACVDATAGAKTGVNLLSEKNMIGSFRAPEAIFMDTRYLQSLPREEWLSGMAEVLKHGLIADAAYWEDCLAGKPGTMEMIRRSVGIKSAIVAADPLENGLRKVLNFGHTVGHALEAAFTRTGVRVTHGACVAAGMWMESLAAEAFAGLSSGEGGAIRAGLSGLFPALPVEQLPAAGITALMYGDKKNRRGEIRMSLPDRIGHCLFDIPVPGEAAEEWLHIYTDTCQK